jgi:hypothetical protein
MMDVERAYRYEALLSRGHSYRLVSLLYLFFFFFFFFLLFSQ